jgi:hypothetical protein
MVNAFITVGAVLWVTSHDLTRTAGTLTSMFHAHAATATI